MVYTYFEKSTFARFLGFTYYLRFSRRRLCNRYVVARFVAPLIILRFVAAIPIIETFRPHCLLIVFGSYIPSFKLYRGSS